MFHILGIIIPIDFHIFQSGRYTTNQIASKCSKWILALYVYVYIYTFHLQISINIENSMIGFVTGLSLAVSTGQKRLDHGQLLGLAEGATRSMVVPRVRPSASGLVHSYGQWQFLLGKLNFFYGISSCLMGKLNFFHGKWPYLLAKLTISLGIFNSKVLVYQRVDMERLQS